MSFNTTGLELVSKYEAISCEKVTDTVKITLALQNVRGNLAQFLNVSVSDSTWSQVHSLLINYFNNAAPVDTKGIYQFTSDTRTSTRKRIKGPQVVFSFKRRSHKAKERPSQRVKVNGPHVHGIRIKIELNVIKKVTKERMAKEKCFVR